MVSTQLPGEELQRGAGLRLLMALERHTALCQECPCLGRHLERLGRAAPGGQLEDARSVGVEPELGDEPPWGPLESVVALQHLARSLAVHLGRDVDEPRNPAKSVTVE